jgi:hypothetical protein
MIVAADASVLVGELLRERGRQLLLHPSLHVVVAEDQWEEAEHEPRGPGSGWWRERVLQSETRCHSRRQAPARSTPLDGPGS